MQSRDSELTSSRIIIRLFSKAILHYLQNMMLSLFFSYISIGVKQGEILSISSFSQWQLQQDPHFTHVNCVLFLQQLQYLYSAFLKYSCTFIWLFWKYFFIINTMIEHNKSLSYRKYQGHHISIYCIVIYGLYVTGTIRNLGKNFSLY
jgi:hypothetical protein